MIRLERNYFINAFGAKNKRQCLGTKGVGYLIKAKFQLKTFSTLVMISNVVFYGAIDRL